MKISIYISKLILASLFVFSCTIQEDNYVTNLGTIDSCDLKQLQNNFGLVFEEEINSVDDEVNRLFATAQILFPTKSNEDIAEMIAIVSPELLRYSQFKDFFETTALEVAYLKEGTQTADFSVGLFQMKPSFAENLNPDKTREEILNSLKSITGQLLFLNQFIEKAEQRHDLAKYNRIERTRFLATAYNYGMFASTETLLNVQNEQWFPYGKKYEGEQYNYSAIAEKFYVLCLNKSVCYE